VPRIARSQAYPSRPVRVIVGFPAGSGPAIIARLIGQGFSERLGHQFVIENRPGAAGNIATEIVVKAPSDGYTLYWGTERTLSARRSTRSLALISFATFFSQYPHAEGR
jgi:tripartite-type tricarboxylate transporter receptor subunit TctC